MDTPDRISLGADTCKNVKSRRNPKDKCTNPATHGSYCGIHFKHPKPWTPGSPDTIAKRVKRRYEQMNAEQQCECIRKIQSWFRRWNGFLQYRRRGIGFWDRSLNTNDSDFFSTDAVKDIPRPYFFSFRDADSHVYAFDARSIHMLIQRAQSATEEGALNPYTRSSIPIPIQRRVSRLVRWLQIRKLPTEWTPLSPPTPDQQWRMKVVDLFTKIDELNYYSSPDWFIGLTTAGHKRFYAELHAIWTHRAGLSIQQKNTIVPGFSAKLFRYPPWGLLDHNIDSLQRLNMGIIRMFITSAEDKNDRILGAMYIVSALTLVNDQARNAYPWLYESVSGMPATHGNIIMDEARMPAAPLFGIGWLNDFIALTRERMPPLLLPPPATANTSPNARTTPMNSPNRHTPSE